MNIRDQVYRRLAEKKGYIRTKKKNILGYDSYTLVYPDCAGFVGVANFGGNEKMLAVMYVDAKELESSSEDEKESPSEEIGKSVYDIVDQMPSFPGGTSAMMKYIDNNLKYPVVAQKNGVQGRVVVSFVVERDGSIAM